MINFKTLKTISASIILLFLWSISNSQNEITYGKAYRNVVDFKNDKPLYKSKFIFSLNKLKYYDLYKVRSDSLRIPSKEIKYGIWIISVGDHFYFNAARHGFKPGYIKFRKGINYYYFYSEPVNSVIQNNRIKNSFYEYGITGLSISTMKVNKENKIFQHNVLDLKKGTTDVLSVKYIQKLLHDHPDLLNEFNLIENNNDLDVLKLFLNKVNEKLKSI